MTAGPTEDAPAAATQAAGEAAARQHETAAQAQHRTTTTGSDVAVEAAAGPDDISVAWSPADDTAQPTLQPSSPPAVNSFERDVADRT